MPTTSTAPPHRVAAPNRLTHQVDSNLRPADSRERMDHIQRTRLLAAMVDVAAERGLAEATVARVVARAGVSRRTFYELFADRERCFLAAMDDAISRVTDCVIPAYESGANWTERLHLALAALLSFLEHDRSAGRLLIVGSLGAGPAALERRSRLLAHVIDIVDGGRAESRARHEPPPLTADGVVGGALAIIHERLVEGAQSLMDLLGPLTSMIVSPYLGPAAARRELARPAPLPAILPSRVHGDPLRDLGMRLTYRTVRVLMFIAARPRSSNREVGAAAGVHDQGQVSKLLSRLQRLGLLENVGGPPNKGEPNAWMLTGKGHKVTCAISVEDSGQLASGGD